VIGTPLGKKFLDTVWTSQGYKSLPGKKYIQKIRKNEDFKNAIVKLKISTMNHLSTVQYTNWTKKDQLLY
jgi:hypothetical protein